LVKLAIQNGLTTLEESSFPYTSNQTFPIDPTSKIWQDIGDRVHWKIGGASLKLHARKYLDSRRTSGFTQCAPRLVYK
jgi:hypothetical protein